jgi:hypothetical protein
MNDLIIFGDNGFIERIEKYLVVDMVAGEMRDRYVNGVGSVREERNLSNIIRKLEVKQNGS